MPDTRDLCTGIHFGEGPRWHDGRLWFSDFFASAVKTVDSGGEVTDVVEVPGQPSGLGWLPGGDLLIVSLLGRVLYRWDGDRLHTYADLSNLGDAPYNDMVVDGQGRAYVGNMGFAIHEASPDVLADPPTGFIARVDPDGRAEIAADDLRFPNGTVITPDGATLVVGESLGARLSAFDLGDDGALSGRRVFADLPGTAPDGICLDADGAVWVANAFGNECIRVASGGEVLARITTSQPAFACMLGGPAERTLHVMTAPGFLPHQAAGKGLGKVEVVDVDVPRAGWP